MATLNGTDRFKLIEQAISLKQSLSLLDEFGSGSDPELGSALAEVFFEEQARWNGCDPI